MRACARRGHVTYAPAERDLARRVYVESAQGEAWRCLRCGDYVVGPPAGAGPADHAPIVLRGKPLRDAVVLRVLAVERGFRGLVLLAASYAIFRFKLDHDALQRLFDRDLPAFRRLGQDLHFDVESSVIVKSIRHVLAVRSSTLTFVAVFAAVYAVIELVEAVGLWRLERWGEYFAVVATSVFLPLEIYELAHDVTITRVGAFLVNVALIVYLVGAKRLFGARGGGAAYEAERRSESLLEVQESAALR